MENLPSYAYLLQRPIFWWLHNKWCPETQEYAAFIQFFYSRPKTYYVSVVSTTDQPDN